MAGMWEPQSLLDRRTVVEYVLSSKTNITDVDIASQPPATVTKQVYNHKWLLPVNQSIQMP